jgi:5'-3' exonuclease
VRRPPKNGSSISYTNTLLVDGNALFKTGYHGAKSEYNRRGEHIGGLYQFITVLRRLLTENLYHRVFVFWDGKFSGKLRYDIYPEYKSGRGKDYVRGTTPDDQSLVLQRFMVQEYLEELFIRQLEDEIVESDDFIAYFCLTKPPTEKVTICTNDRDLCQLISDNVRVYLCDKKSYVTEDNYMSFFKHHPKNCVLVKVISGDNSDTIYGVKGVKETTLLKHFPEIATRPVMLDEILTKAKLLQDGRINNKQKPLKALDNIINGNTDGSQGDRLYEINELLVNLDNPMMTENSVKSINNLIDLPLNPEDRGIKNAYKKIKRDGIDKVLGEQKFTNYLMPFKKLMEREKKAFISENK